MMVQEIINFTLHYIADLDIPIKRLVDWKPDLAYIMRIQLGKSLFSFLFISPGEHL